jgi:hypothetical protein
MSNAIYYVLASSDAALPLDQWTRIATNQFDTAGNFSVTNAIDLSGPHTFFTLQLP